MGSKSEVYDAEMAGLAWAASEALDLQYANAHPEVRHIHFFADNTAALAAIFDPKPAARQAHAQRFRRYVELFLDRNPANTIDIDWSPGHEDIRGDEWADELAKAAAETRCTVEFTTLTHAKRATKDRALAKWTEKWKKKYPTGRFGPTDRLPPAWKPKLHFTAPRGRCTED
jgi:ribonuclease HI